MSEKITFQLLAGSTCSGGKCPAIYLGSDGKYYIQGTAVSNAVRESLGTPEGEEVVCIPAELIPGNIGSR